jgi:hypothetical protein
VVTDPTTVQLTILKPDGSSVVVTTGTFAHTGGSGVYVYKYQPLPAVGTYYYQWQATFSTGDLATWEDNFTVSITPGSTSEKF